MWKSKVVLYRLSHAGITTWKRRRLHTWKTKMHSSANCWTINWFCRYPTRPTFSCCCGSILFWLQLDNKLAIYVANIKPQWGILHGLFGFFVVGLFVFYQTGSVENISACMGRIMTNDWCLLPRNVHSYAHLCQIALLSTDYVLCRFKLDPHVLCFVSLHAWFHMMARPSRCYQQKDKLVHDKQSRQAPLAHRFLLPLVSGITQGGAWLLAQQGH